MYDLTAIESYIKSKGWQSKQSETRPEDLNVKDCAYCGNDKWAFYINKSTGLHNCQDCGRGGNLFTLRQEMGDEEPSLEIESFKTHRVVKNKDLPDVAACHEALLADTDAMLYLERDRGYTREAIIKCQLGLTKNYFLSLEKTVKSLVIPYFKKGKLIYAKYRSLPPEPKAFDNTSSGLWMYNMDVLSTGIQELVMVEGEPDAIATMSIGFDSVIGIPGAKTGKADWLGKIDQIKIVYVLFDNDKAGKEAAENWATRIGLDKVRNVVLPTFINADGKQGKDINDFLLWRKRAGAPKEEIKEDFLNLLRTAKPFTIAGVQSTSEVLDELEQGLLENGPDSLLPKLKSPWIAVNERLGGAEFGDLGSILAEGKCGKTTFALNWLEHFVEVMNLSSFMFCLEMRPPRLVRKWASYVTQTDDNKFNAKTIQDARIWCDKREAELLFGYIRWNQHKQIFDTIRNVHKRYGTKIVCFDNLHLLVRSMDKTTQEVTILVNLFKEIAMELNILLLLILQPNRVLEGKTVSARNAKWSSDIEKAVDWLITLHRNPKITLSAAELGQMGKVETDAALDNMMYGNVELSRYSAGGYFTLQIDGAKSLIKDLDSKTVQEERVSDEVRQQVEEAERQAQEGI